MADDPDNNDSLKPLLGFLENLRKGQESGQGSGPNFFELLLSLFKFILGDDPNGQSGDGQDTSARQKPEVSAGEFYNRPGNLTRIPEELSRLRARGDQVASSPADVELRVTAGFGELEAGVHDKPHAGIDLAPIHGTGSPDVKATKDGVVVYAQWKEGYGNTVIFADGNGHQHLYGHLAKIDVKVGDEVKRNEKLGIMGSTGHSTGLHLHYEERDEHGKPVPPEILGKLFAKGQNITVEQNQQFLAGLHNEGQNPVVVADNRPPAQASDLGNFLAAINTEHSGSYIPPVGAGTKPAQSNSKSLG